MKIRSKIGIVTLMLTLLALLITLATFLYWAIVKDYIPTIVCVALTILIICPIYLNTHYTIKSGHLYIHFGLFCIFKKIPCTDIISMTDNVSYQIAPALSSDRICLKYIKNEKIKTIYISPANKQDFRNAIQQEITKNPALAELSKRQIKEEVLLNTLKQESSKQEKMDEIAYEEQQIQNQKDIMLDNQELQKLEKRMRKSEAKKYEQEQLNAIKEANKQIDEEQKQREKYQDGRENLKRKQLSTLLSLQDQREKQERKAENERWEKQRREKEKQELAKQKMIKRERKRQEKLAKETQKNIKKQFDN